VLFAPGDVGRGKAQGAADGLRRIHPGLDITAIQGDAGSDIGTAFFGQFDVVVAAVDSRLARLAINRACWKMSRPLVDGALEPLGGVVRGFVPPDSACYECTLSDVDFQAMPQRTSCGLLAREAAEAGGVPTTVIGASIVGAMQAAEVMKHLHPDLPAQRLAGEGYVFDAARYDPMRIRYPRKPDDRCASHQTYDALHRLPGTRHELTVADLQAFARDQGVEPLRLVLERALVTAISCVARGRALPIWQPELKFRGDPLPCPACGHRVRRALTRQALDPAELSPHATLTSLGLPPLDIVTLAGREGNLRVVPHHDATEPPTRG